MAYRLEPIKPPPPPLRKLDENCFCELIEYMQDHLRSNDDDKRRFHDYECWGLLILYIAGKSMPVFHDWLVKNYDITHLNSNSHIYIDHIFRTYHDKFMEHIVYKILRDEHRYYPSWLEEKYKIYFRGEWTD